jgi:hypothetical protein
MKPGNRPLRNGAKSCRMIILKDEEGSETKPSCNKGFFNDFVRKRRAFSWIKISKVY